MSRAFPLSVTSRLRLLALPLLLSFALAPVGANAGGTPAGDRAAQPAAPSRAAQSQRWIRDRASPVVDATVRGGARVIARLTVTRAPGARLALSGSRGALVVRDLVGKGFYGAVYRLDEGSRQALVPAYPGEVVVKLPHTWRFGVGALRDRVAGSRQARRFAATATRKLEAEAAMYDFLEGEALPRARQSTRWYPRDSAWGDRLPVVPILARVETTSGPALVKPFALGKSLHQVFEEGGDLTEPMKQSLREIYGFVQSVGEQVRVAGGSDLKVPVLTEGGRPLALDVRPANLMWIEDPHMQSLLGLSRPSFLFVELDQSFRNYPQYLASNMSFDGYLAAARRQGLGK